MQTKITFGQVAERRFMLEIGLEIGCRKCDRYGRQQIAPLIAEHGTGRGLNTGSLLRASAIARRRAMAR
jgi:hypothetical protein